MYSPRRKFCPFVQHGLKEQKMLLVSSKNERHQVK